MKGFIKDLWWLLLLSGKALLLFGLTTVVWPGITLVSLAVFFAVYVILSGVMDILVAIGSIAYKKGWFLTLILGVVEIAAGIYVLKTPGLALELFIFAAGIIFMIQGIFTIITSFVDTTDAGLRVLEVVSGILGIAAGFIVFRNPVSAGIAFTWVLGVYGLIAGTMRVAAALSLRQTVEELGELVGVQKPIASRK
jgi:uncharacterized membrane protein HdeD (DUF308 family)